MARVEKLAATFVELTDTLVNDYEVEVLLQRLVDRCADVVSAAAAGVLLTDATGALRLAAASTDDMLALELFEMQHEEGPCYEAFDTGRQVSDDDLSMASQRWPTFARRAEGLGFRSVHAFPLRLRESTIGALNVFFESGGPFSDTDIHILQALADVATIAILQERRTTESAELSEQLQIALDSRIVIEQAKGILMEGRGVTAWEAFEVIRGHARSSNRRVRDVAQELVDGELEPDDI